MPFIRHPCQNWISFLFNLCFCCGHMILGLKILRNFIFKLLSLASTVSRRKIQNMCPDCPIPANLSDPKVLETAIETLERYNRDSESGQYSLVKVTQASSQVRWKCPVTLTMSHDCCYQFLNWEENIKALLLVIIQSLLPALVDLMHIQSIMFQFLSYSMKFPQELWDLILPHCL